MHKKNLNWVKQKPILILLFSLIVIFTIMVINFQFAEAEFSDTGKVRSLNNEKQLSNINKVQYLDDLGPSDSVSYQVDETDKLIVNKSGDSTTTDTYTPVSDNANFKFDHWALQLMCDNNKSKDVLAKNESHSSLGKHYDPGNVVSTKPKANNIYACYSDKITAKESDLGSFNQPFDYVYLYGQALITSLTYVTDVEPTPAVTAKITVTKNSDGTYYINVLNIFYSNHSNVDYSAEFTFTPNKSNDDIAFVLEDINGNLIGKLSPNENATYTLTDEVPMTITPIKSEQDLFGLQVYNEDGSLAENNKDYVVVDGNNNTFYLKKDNCTIKNVDSSVPVPMHLVLGEGFKSITHITLDSLFINAEAGPTLPFIYLEALENNCQIDIKGDCLLDYKKVNLIGDYVGVFQFSFSSRHQELNINGVDANSKLSIKSENETCIYLDGYHAGSDGEECGGGLKLSGLLSMQCETMHNDTIDIESGGDSEDSCVKFTVGDFVNLRISCFEVSTGNNVNALYTYNCDMTFYWYSSTEIIASRIDPLYADASVKLVDLIIKDNASLNVINNGADSSPIGSAYGYAANMYDVSVKINTNGLVRFISPICSAIYLSSDDFPLGTFEVDNGTVEIRGEAILWGTPYGAATFYCEESDCSDWKDNFHVNDTLYKFGAETVDADFTAVKENIKFAIADSSEMSSYIDDGESNEEICAKTIVVRPQKNAVVFNYQDNLTKPKPIYVNSETGKVDKPEDPSRAGFSFDNWLTDPEDSTSIFDFDKVIDTDVNVYASWKSATYNITWDPVGGTGGTDGSTTYTIENTSITMPSSAPTKTGYTFEGWLASGTSGATISGWPTTAFTVPPTLTGAYGNVTLTAQWTVNNYTITWDVAGGTGGTDGFTTYTIENTSINMPSSAPTKTGYTFKGWLASATSGSISGWPSTAFTDPPTLTGAYGNVTLTAQWTANTYQVTFDANGGVWDNFKTEIIIEETFDGHYILPDNDPNRDGFTFAGWFLETSVNENDNNQINSQQITEETIVKVDGVHTICAHWTENPIPPIPDPQPQPGGQINNTAQTSDNTTPFLLMFVVFATVSGFLARKKHIS